MYIPEPGDTCWGCAYYEHSMEMGECRRSAPAGWLQRVDKECVERSAYWPQVHTTDWCGDFVDAPMARLRERDRREVIYEEQLKRRIEQIRAESAAQGTEPDA